MALGITQKELADKLQVHQTAIAQWENGKTHPRFNRLEELADALSCTVDELTKEP